MYVAELDGRGERWLIGAVRMPHMRLQPGSEVARDWRQMLLPRASLLADTAFAGIGVRLVADADGRIDRTVMTLTCAAEEARLRHVLGGFVMLERIDNQTVELPPTRSVFDSWMADFPRRQSLVAPIVQRIAGGAWVASAFRCADHLEDLLAQAASLRYRIGYQANVSPYRPTRDALRAVARNILDLEAAPAVPSAIAVRMRGLCDDFRQCSMLVDEYLGAEDEESARWLTEWVRRRFRRAVGEAGLAPPELDLRDEGAAEALTLPGHRAWVFGPEAISIEEIAGQATSDESIFSHLVTLRPAVEPHAAAPYPQQFGFPVSPPPVPPAGPPGLAELPSPFEGDRGYLFISYKREDLPRVATYLKSLDEMGHPFWYDRGIPGGSEWDAILEQRIIDCDWLVVFLSPATVASKYCRREIKYADALDKPILALLLEPTALRDGLGMLLQQYQMIDAARIDWMAQVTRALTQTKSGA